MARVPTMQPKEFGPAQDALNRLRKAELRGTGCHLTAEMIRSLAITAVGAIWSEPDPREEPHHDQ